MNHFERIFQQKLAPGKLDPKLPVSCSLFDIYQSISSEIQHKSSSYCHPKVAKKPSKRRTSVSPRKIWSTESSWIKDWPFCNTNMTKTEEIHWLRSSSLSRERGNIVRKSWASTKKYHFTEFSLKRKPWSKDWRCSGNTPSICISFGMRIRGRRNVASGRRVQSGRCIGRLLIARKAWRGRRVKKDLWSRVDCWSGIKEGRSWFMRSTRRRRKKCMKLIRRRSKKRCQRI